MGGSGLEGGVMTGRLHSRKTIRGLDDVPPKIRAYTEKHHPEYFEAPAGWDVSGPILSSWEAYAAPRRPRPDTSAPDSRRVGRSCAPSRQKKLRAESAVQASPAQVVAPARARARPQAHDLTLTGRGPSAYRRSRAPVPAVPLLHR